MAADCCGRFGWSWRYICDDVPLVVLSLLLRQPRPGCTKDGGITTADLDIMDWMDEHGIAPGDAIP